MIDVTFLLVDFFLFLSRYFFITHIFDKVIWEKKNFPRGNQIHFGLTYRYTSKPEEKYNFDRDVRIRICVSDYVISHIIVFSRNISLTGIVKFFFHHIIVWLIQKCSLTFVIFSRSLFHAYQKHLWQFSSICRPISHYFLSTNNAIKLFIF